MDSKPMDLIAFQIELEAKTTMEAYLLAEQRAVQCNQMNDGEVAAFIFEDESLLLVTQEREVRAFNNGQEALRFIDRQIWSGCR